MQMHDDVFRLIDQLPEGPETGAFFSCDETLIAGSSAVDFLKSQLRSARLNPPGAAELAAATAQFKLGATGMPMLVSLAALFMRGMSESRCRAIGEQWYEQQIAQKIYPELRALVEAHLARGHTVVLLSSATQYQAEPAAQDLGIPHLLCNRFEFEDDQLTGRVRLPLCSGRGKVRRAERFASEYGVDLGRSCVYADSIDDLGLMQRIGFPRALNPSRELSEKAQHSGWAVQRFVRRGDSGWLGGGVHRYAVTGSLVGAYLAALPFRALSGSTRQAQNFGISCFAGLSSALAGLKLEVTGEGNLWLQRPAVIIFNHQSHADIIIMARLVRRDAAGIGKQEIRSIPVLGKILESVGVVFVDRSDSSRAIEAMRPLVETLRREQKNVLIAPEGTRTPTRRLAPFRKGAFHLAMQAGVPIIPVVIHNAIDVQPKGDEMYYPATVKVDVLPPVDTCDWRAETIDRHVSMVRAMYLETLGQEDAGPNTGTAGQLAGKRAGGAQ